MNHYFIDDDTPLNPFEITIFYQNIKYKFYSDRSIFSAKHLDQGTSILLDFVIKEKGKTLLDLGCGYGPIGVLSALLLDNCLVDMVDINSRAVAISNKNIERYKLQNVKCYQSDGFASIDKNFDIIAFNPPIKAGKSVIYRLIDEAYQHLTDDGHLLIVIKVKHGAASAVKHLKLKFECETVMKSNGYHLLKAKKLKERRGM